MQWIKSHTSVSFLLLPSSDSQGSLPGPSMIKFRFDEKINGHSFFNNLQGLLTSDIINDSLFNVYK
jgi:hypothetical protein